jgi:hypothetical protein
MENANGQTSIHAHAGGRPDRVIEELLIECSDAARSCIALGNAPDYEDYRVGLMGVAARPMKTGIAFAASLKKDSEFTHRIIVERAEPSTRQISGKTIHRVQAPNDPQD